MRIPVANLMKFMKAHNIPFDGLMSGSFIRDLCVWVVVKARKRVDVRHEPAVPAGKEHTVG